MQYKHEYGVELEELICKVTKDKDGGLLHEFLFDLLSPAEYRDLAIRFQIVKQLDAKVSQRDIAKNLKIGVATVNRGALELQNKKGGFATVLKKYYSKK